MADPRSSVPRYKKNYMVAISNSQADRPYGLWKALQQDDSAKRHVNNWDMHLGNYLQLRPNGIYVRNITVYCHGLSITGIATHDYTNPTRQLSLSRVPETNLVGWRDQMSVAIYLPLIKDEELASVWTSRDVTVGSKNWESSNCPPILVRFFYPQP